MPVDMVMVASLETEAFREDPEKDDPENAAAPVMEAATTATESFIMLIG
jgi:hypothetical protein